MKKLMKNLNASEFIINYTTIPLNKYRQIVRGYDGNRQPLKFTEADRQQIVAGLHRLIEDINKKKL